MLMGRDMWGVDMILEKESDQVQVHAVAELIERSL